MKTLRRILCVILVLATVLGSLSAFASCKKNEKLPEKRTVSNAYKMKTIDLPDGVRDLGWLGYENGKLIFLGYTYESDDSWRLLSQDIYELDPVTGEYTSMPLTLDDNNEWVSGIGRTDNGYVVVTSCYTWSETEGSKEYWYAYNYTFDGEIVNKFDLYELLGLGTSDGSTDDEYYYVYLNHIDVSENGDIVLFTNTCAATVSSDGTQVRKFDFDESIINGDSYVNGCYDYGKDQYMMVTVTWTYTETESSEKVEYRILDLTSGTFSEPQEFSQSVIETGYYSMLTDSNPESPYDFYFQGSDGISGYSMETDTFTQLLNWINSDMTRGEMGSIIPVNADLFYGTAYDLDTYEMTLVSLTRIPDEEQIPKYVITLAYEGYSYNITNAVVKFNRISDEYRIELKAYANSNNSGIIYKDAAVIMPSPSGGSSTSENTADLRQDILTGNIPDILLVNDGMNIDSYINKGIFADIYEYMDNDETFDKSQYLTNIFEAFEVNGKLYELAPTFRISTLAAKKSILDGVEGWTMEEFTQFLSRFPEGTYASLDMNRSYFLEMILACNYNTFVDRDTGKCYFDTDEFKKVLEYAKTLSETSVWDDVYGDEYDQELAESLSTAYRDDRALLYPMYVYDFSSYMDAAGSYTFGGTDIGFVGYPSSDRSGHAIMADNILLAMSAQSHSVVKEGVWEFFKYLLSDSYQDPDYNYGGFPVKISALEKLAKQTQETDFGWQWYGDDGYWIDGGIDMPVVEPYSTEDETVETEGEPLETEDETVTEEGTEDTETVLPEEPIAPDEPIVSSGREYYMTDEQINEVLDLIKNIKHVRVDNTELLDIITQESAAYFEGKKGLDETVDIIQRRANIFINTNR